MDEASNPVDLSVSAYLDSRRQSDTLSDLRELFFSKSLLAHVLLDHALQLNRDRFRVKD